MVLINLNSGLNYHEKSYFIITNNGAVWNDVGGYDGNGAYEFDGINDYVSMGDVLDIHSGDYSASAWIKTTMTSTGTVVGKNSVASRSWALYVNHGADTNKLKFSLQATAGGGAGQ